MNYRDEIIKEPYVLRETDDGVDGPVIIQVLAGAVVACADSANALVRTSGITVKDGPAGSRGQVRDGAGRAILRTKAMVSDSLERCGYRQCLPDRRYHQQHRGERCCCACRMRRSRSSMAWSSHWQR